MSEIENKADILYQLEKLSEKCNQLFFDVEIDNLTNAQVCDKLSGLMEKLMKIQSLCL